jgi:MFS family permease
VLDATIVSIALPTIAHDFGEPVLRLNGAITVYLLPSALFIPISGWLSDRFSAKRVFLGSLIVFVIGSLLCGLSTNSVALVGSRFCKGRPRR